MNFAVCNLLIVDRRPAFRARLRALVDGFGVGVTELDSTASALDLADHRDWLLIIIGVQAKAPQSFDVIREFRAHERCRRTPVVLAAAEPLTADELRYAHGLGVLDVLCLHEADEDLLRHRLVTVVELLRQQAELEQLLRLVQEDNQLLIEENERIRRQQDHVQRDARDALTGLPTLLLFNDRLDAALLRAQRLRNRCAVVFLDVVVDSAPDGGLDSDAELLMDQVVVAVSRRLTQQLRASDCVARLGGDEFGLVLENISLPSMALQLVQKLVQSAAEPVCLNNADGGSAGQLTPTVVAGIALYPDHGLRREELMMLADMAMYRLLQEGRSDAVLYDSAELVG